MTHSAQLTPQDSLLLVVDVQERLFAAMDPEHREDMVRNIKVLAAAARRLGFPILVTEQYPKGLGHTLPEIKDALGNVASIEKVSFSCCEAQGFTEQLTAAGKTRIILTGMEAHVCVLLTALGLLEAGYAVHVVADAVCSRSRENWRIALDQIRQAGAIVTSTETVLFQLLGRADTEDFKALQPLVK